MSEERKLTSGERKTVEKRTREREQRKHPNATVRAFAGNKLGGDGKVEVGVVTTTLTEGVNLPEEIPTKKK